MKRKYSSVYGDNMSIDIEGVEFERWEIERLMRLHLEDSKDSRILRYMFLSGKLSQLLEKIPEYDEDEI